MPVNQVDVLMIQYDFSGPVSYHIINFCMPEIVGKAGTSAGLTLRTRVNGADTDVNVTAGTTDAWRGQFANLLTPSLTKLNASEIGAVRRGSGSNAAQVEDEWMMCGYTVVAATGSYGSFGMTGVGR